MGEWKALIQLGSATLTMRAVVRRGVVGHGQRGPYQRGPESGWVNTRQWDNTFGRRESAPQNKAQAAGTLQVHRALSLDAQGSPSPQLLSLNSGLRSGWGKSR